MTEINFSEQNGENRECIQRCVHLELQGGSALLLGPLKMSLGTGGREDGAEQKPEASARVRAGEL
jgi:hypothetical protein